MAAEPVLMHGSALLKELQQGCKMPSLDALKVKLDEDHHRHLDHTANVQAGIAKVRNADKQAETTRTPCTPGREPALADAEAALESPSPDSLTKKRSYPEAVRSQVEAARAGAYPASWAEVDAAVQPKQDDAGRADADAPAPAAIESLAGTSDSTVVPGSLSATAPTAQEKSPAPSPRSKPVTVALGTGSFTPRDLRKADAPGSRGPSKATSERKTGTAIAMGLKYDKAFLSRDPARKVLACKHEDEVMGLAFGPDGKTLLSGGEDRTLVLWDFQSGTRLREAKAKDAIKAVAFSPSGEFVSAADVSSRVTVWRASTFEEVGSTEIDAGDVMSLTMSSAGRELLALGTTEKSVLVYSVPDMCELADMWHDGDVHSLAFSPNGDMLAGGGGIDDTHGLMTNKGDDHEMKTVIWSVIDDASVPSCLEYMGAILFDDIIHATVFAPNSKLLASGGENCMIAISLVDRDFEQCTELQCTAGVRCLSWTPDSRFLAAAGEDNRISVWDVVEEAVVLQLPKARDWYCDVSFSFDGLWLAGCGYGCSEVALHPVLLSHEPPSARAASASKDAVASAPVREPPRLSLAVPDSAGGFVDPDEVGEDAGERGLSSMGLSSMGVSRVAIQLPPDGTESAGRNGLQVMMPRESLKGAGTVKFDGTGAAESDAAPATPVAVVPAVVEMGESSCAASGFQLKVGQVGAKAAAADTSVLEMQRSEQRFVKALMLGARPRPASLAQSSSREAVKMRQSDEVLALDFSPDGRYLATSGEDSTLVIWDVGQGTRASETRLEDPVAALAFSRSGRHVAAVTEGSTLFVWDTEKREEAGSIEIDGSPMSVAIGASDLLAVGTTEKQVILFDLPTLQEIAVLGHSGHVRSLSFSPCGRLLAGGGGSDDMHGLMTNKTQDNSMTAVIWQVASSGEDCKYSGSISFSDIVHATAFSPSGKVLAVAGENCLIDILLVDREFEKASEFASSAGVRCLGWSPDSRFLASGGEDMQVTVWDVIFEQLLFKTPKASDWVSCVGFSPDGRWLAVCGYGSSEATLHPVELEDTAEDDGEAEDDEGEVASPSGLLSPTDREEASQSTKPLRSRSLSAVKDDPVRSPSKASSRGSKRSARESKGCFEHKVPSQARGSMATGEGSQKPEGFAARRSGALSRKAIAAVQEGLSRKSLAQLGKSPVMPRKVVDISDGFQVQIDATACAPSSSSTGAQEAEREKLWLSQAGLEQCSLALRLSESREPVDFANASEVMAMSVSPDGKFLVVGGEDGLLVLMDASSKSKTNELRLSAAVRAVAFSPLGEYVVAADANNLVKVWSFAGAEVASEYVDAPVLSLAVGREDAEPLVAVGTSSSKVVLLSLPALSPVADLRHGGHVSSLTFSPSGALLAGSTGAGIPRDLADQGGLVAQTVVWELSAQADGCKHLGCITSSRFMNAVRFSPNGKILAVGGHGNAVTLHLVDQGFQQVAELPADAGVTCLAWSANSRLLASAGDDARISVFDVVERMALFQLPKSSGPARCIEFGSTPDSQWLATCAWGSESALLWPLEVHGQEAAA